jgi:hypothetical protein
MMTLNLYYILAIVFLALSALFGYLGTNLESKRSSDDQLDKISERFDELGERISGLQSSAVSTSDLEGVNEEYRRIAREYLEILPQKAQQLTVDTERRRLAEIERSREIQQIADFVSRTLADLVRSFASEGAPITFTATPFPSNIFSPQPFQIRLSADEMDYWSLHFVDRRMDKIGLMLVRITRNSVGQETLTNDSIVFRWIGSDQYGFSLNDRISSEVRQNVFDGLDNQVHSISQAEEGLERLLINLVKYELARKRPTTRSQ